MPIHKKLTGKIKISPDDIDLLIKYHWSKDSHNYIQGIVEGKLTKLHILIAKRIYGEYDENLQVDHKNRNKLNCRRLNLRLVTSQQNAFNRSVRSDNKSGYKGVMWSKDRNKWVSQIRINNSCKHLGYFVNILDAAKAYNKAAVELFGEFANINKI